MLPGELADARKRDEDEVAHFEVTYFESFPPEIADAYWAQHGGRPQRNTVAPTHPEPCSVDKLSRINKGFGL